MQPDERTPEDGRVEFSNNDQLSEVERRLHACQPRPPALDMVVIAEVAAGGACSQPSLARTSADRRKFLGALAGSWACGAVAGALMMFLTLALHEQSAPSSESVKKRVPVAGATQQPDLTNTEPRAEIPSERDSLVEVIPRNTVIGGENNDVNTGGLYSLTDLVERYTSPRDAQRPLLCAGAHLSGFEPPVRIEVDDRPPRRERDDVAEKRDVSRMSEDASPPTMTRQQLLRELLDENLHSVL